MSLDPISAAWPLMVNENLSEAMINAIRACVDKRGSGEMPAAGPLVAVQQVLVHILQMAAPEKRRLYVEDFIRSLDRYLRRTAS